MPALSGWDIEEYRKILRGRAIKKRMTIGAREDPSDIVQETLTRALSSPAPMEADHWEQRLGWLDRILNNVFTDKLREHHAGKRNIDLDAIGKQLEETTGAWIEGFPAQQKSPSVQARDKEERSLLAAAIDDLPEREREVMRLQIYGALSMSEIADLLESTKGAVSGLIARAEARLAVALQTKPKMLKKE